MEIVGTSVSGVATRLRVPELKLTFDMGICPPDEVAQHEYVCLTHGHMDHIAAAPYLAALRALGGMVKPKFIMPEHMNDGFKALMDAFGKLDGAFIAHDRYLMGTDGPLPLRKGLDIQVYPMVHRVPSVAYGVHQTRKVLRPEYVGLPGAELGRLRKEGTVLEDEVTELTFAYTGDTTAEGLDNNSVLYTAKCLAIEVTFMDPVTREHAREYGHILLADILDRADKFQNDEIVFVHHSARYGGVEKGAALASLPESLRNRCRWL